MAATHVQGSESTCGSDTIGAGPTLELEVLDLEEMLVVVTDTLEPSRGVFPRRSRSRIRGTRKSAKCPPTVPVNVVVSSDGNGQRQQRPTPATANATENLLPPTPEQLCWQAANGELAALDLVRCGIDDSLLNGELIFFADEQSIAGQHTETDER